MSEKVSEETATQMARELAAAGMPSEEIIRCLVEQGVDRGVAVSVVLIRTSAARRTPVPVSRGSRTPGGPNKEGHIIAAFRRRWNRQIMAAFVALGALLLVVLGSADSRAELLGLTGENWAQAGIALVVGVLLFSFFNYRCPACNGYLGRSFSPTFCRHCGVRLS